MPTYLPLQWHIRRHLSHHPLCTADSHTQSQYLTVLEHFHRKISHKYDFPKNSAYSNAVLEEFRSIFPAANPHRSYTYSMNLLPYRLKNGRLYSYRYVLLFDLYLLADTTEDRYDLILMELCSFLESCSLIGTLFNGWDLWYSRLPQEKHTKFHEKINHIIICSRVRFPFAPYQHLSDLHRALVIDGNFDPEIEEITEYLHFWRVILDRKRISDDIGIG